MEEKNLISISQERYLALITTEIKYKFLMEWIESGRIDSGDGPDGDHELLETVIEIIKEI